jgi:hypothetical protein
MNDSEIIYGVWWDDHDFPEDSQAEYEAYFTTHAAAVAFVEAKLQGIGAQIKRVSS